MNLTTIGKINCFLMRIVQIENVINAVLFMIIDLKIQ